MQEGLFWNVTCARLFTEIRAKYFALVVGMTHY